MNASAMSENTAHRGLFKGCVPLSRGQNKILNIFFYTVLVGVFATMLGAILYYVYAYAALHSGNTGFDWLLGIFSDFVYIMNVSLEESPYIIEDSSYPPIAIAVLYPFALICRGVFAKYAEQVLTVDELTSRVILHHEFWIAMSLFFVICSALVIVITIRRYRLAPIAALKTGILILTSAPFIYAVMRGNTIYFALIFLLLFMLLYKDKNPVLREIGYICLAVSGLIKIYPLFFGVFLLCEKKLWASVRVAIYTVFGFVISFAFFKGGLSDLVPFLENLGEFASNNLRLGAGNNLSLTSVLYKLFALFSGAPDGSAAFGATNTVLLLAVFAIAAVAAVLAKNTFTRCVIASSVVVLIPSVSYFYALVFMLLPFMEFIASYDTMDVKRRRLYTVLFLLLLFPPLIATKFFVPHSIAVIIMLAFECTDVFKKSFFTEKKNRSGATA